MIAVVFLLTGSLWACGVPLEDRAFPLSVAVDYTEGKYDSTGHLICYYWEAGVM